MPIKVIPTVTLEDRLSGLQFSRPLNLQDEVKTFLDTPILDAGRSDTDGPAFGVFGRCDNQGSLLKGNSPPLKMVTPDVNPYWSSSSGLIQCTFPVEVKLIIGMLYLLVPGDFIFWFHPSGLIFKKYEEIKTYTIPFSGTSLWFNCSGSPYPKGMSLAGFY